MNVPRLLLLIASQLLVFMPGTLAADSEASRLAEVSSSIKELQPLLDTIRNKRSTLEASVEKKEKEISALRRDIADTERELKQARKTEGQLRSKNSQLKKEQVRVRSAIDKALSAAYIAGREPHIKLLLGHGDPAKIERLHTYYDYFTAAQSEALVELENNARALRKTHKEIARVNEAVGQKRDKLARREQQLATHQQTRKQLLQRMIEQENRKSSHLDRLQREQRELQVIVQSMQGVVPDDGSHGTFAALRGDVRWPVSGKVAYRFGESRNGSRVPWNGLFIEAPSGTPVIAPHYGRVVFADWLKSFGQLIIVDHGQGYMTLYAHNLRLDKSEGDWVVPGETVALVGNSGGQSRAGLYFEIRHDGRPVNPDKWLLTSPP